MEPTDTDIRRFWRRVQYAPGEGCWEWTGKARANYGYGLIVIGGRQERAHRVAWTLFYGDIPIGMFVLHHCDNPPCVRPDHLFLGSQTANLADMTAKGRRRHGVRDQRGSKNPATHLTEADVAVIKGMVLAGHYHSEAAERFGIDRANVSYIALGKTWAHVAPAEGIPPVERTRYTPKLSAEQRADIRRRYTGARGQKTELAREFGVSVPAIRAVLR